MELIAVLEGLLFIVGEDGISFSKLKEIMEIDDIKLNELIDNYINDIKELG